MTRRITPREDRSWIRIYEFPAPRISPERDPESHDHPNPPHRRPQGRGTGRDTLRVGRTASGRKEERKTGEGSGLCSSMSTQVSPAEPISPQCKGHAREPRKACMDASESTRPTSPFAPSPNSASAKGSFAIRRIHQDEANPLLKRSEISPAKGCISGETEYSALCMGSFTYRFLSMPASQPAQNPLGRDADRGHSASASHGVNPKYTLYPISVGPREHPARPSLGRGS